MATRTTRCSLPVPDSTLPFWRNELHELDSHQSSETLPEICDIVVIGTGFAGVSTTYHLLNEHTQHERKPAIVMLEARGACSGATGRNGGHIKPDVYYNVLKYTQKYGSREAAAVARFEAANVTAVKHLVEEEKLDCDFVLTRALDVCLDQSHADEVKRSYEELIRIGAADLGDVQLTEDWNAEKISGVKGAKSCFSFTAAHVWPYKLVMQLLHKLVQQGVQLHTHTPVNSVSDTQDSEGRWAVMTPRGIINARKVVYASNGYTSHIAPQFTEKIVPVRGICSRIVAADTGRTQRIMNTYSLRFGKAVYDYMIPRLDGSIIIGGAKQDFWDDIKHWYNVTDDSKLIEPAAHYFDGLMQRHFHGWEDSKAYTDKVWTGIMDYSSDFMPYVGPVPGKTGQFIVAGFSGHGMPLMHLSSKELAGMIVRGVKFGDTGLPTVFEPTEKRLSSRKNEILGTTSAARL